MRNTVPIVKNPTKPPETWECEDCGTQNPWSLKICDSCGSERPNMEPN